MIAHDAISRVRATNLPRERLASLVLILASGALIGNMLWIGRSDSLDTVIYRCYAHAFWDGPSMLHAVSTKVCATLWSTPPQQYHTFPREYPPLALAIFSLPLLLPWISYTAGFIAWMAFLTLLATGFLIRRGQIEVAVAFVLYCLLAGWAFALQRFDLVAGLSVLLALVSAQRGRLRSASVLLAVATLLKLFPVILLPFLLIIGFRTKSGSRRWDVVVVFAAVCLAGVLPELLLSASSLLSPIRYELARPLQIESLAGSVLWAGSGMTRGAAPGGPQAVFSYYSLNVVGGPQWFLGTVAIAMGVIGLAVAYRRAWKARDSLGCSFELALLAVLVSGKVLSPQYILWVLPVIAVVEGLRIRWLVLCGLICLITIFYRTEPVDIQFDKAFVATILVRNCVLCGLFVTYAVRPGDLEKQ